MDEWKKVNKTLQEVSKERDDLFLENELLKSYIKEGHEYINHANRNCCTGGYGCNCGLDRYKAKEKKLLGGE